MDDDQFRTFSVQRVGRPPDGNAFDRAAVEEPLEIRLHGKPFAVVMRTPGDDRALAAGFLLAEGIVRGFDDIGAIEHCRHPSRPEEHNVVDVYLLGAAAATLPRVLDERRNVLATSSCGICGRVTIDSLETRAPRVPLTTCFDAAILSRLPDLLRVRQRGFDDTGGLHAAGLFDDGGACESSAEDVGRHNAVDKVIGGMLLQDRIPVARRALAVSGRASYEIVQKAWIAGVEVVSAVSAPSSLAIETAQRAGITLLGFVREGGFNVYSHPTRIAGTDPSPLIGIADTSR